MGRRSGVPHRDDELARLSEAQLGEEIARCRSRLGIAASAKAAKQWRKRLHWLERALGGRGQDPGSHFAE